MTDRAWKNWETGCSSCSKALETEKLWRKVISMIFEAQKPVQLGPWPHSNMYLFCFGIALEFQNAHAATSEPRARRHL